MSSKYKIGDERYAHFVTFTVVHWIDVFTRDEYREIILESLNYCVANKGLVVHAFCIMTNHVHLIPPLLATIYVSELPQPSVVVPFRPTTSCSMMLRKLSEL